ncbi:uncharacterized protein LOC130679936 [Manis pentadactyla]|uniref:uncharacterized protein LOC130679936 n=1 Tax=Manis pentadactyla TaxID=143292 RepID=UPI00255CA3EB|nr:uncharacterized protein LOC130679936 [Manis pentadactyla]
MSRPGEDGPTFSWNRVAATRWLMAPRQQVVLTTREATCTNGDTLGVVGQLASVQRATSRGDDTARRRPDWLQLPAIALLVTPVLAAQGSWHQATPLSPDSPGSRVSSGPPAIASTGDPGRGRPCSATGPTPAPDPTPAPALTGGLTSGSSLDARPPVKWGQGGRQTRPLGAWGTLLPPSAPPSHPAHLKSAPRLGRSTAEDLPQGPLPSRRLASIYLVEPLPVSLLVHLFKFFKHPGAFPKGRGEEEGTCGQQVGSLGADQFSWRPQISTSLQEAIHHSPGPWALRGLGRGLRVSTRGLHSQFSPGRICFGPGRCPWGRDLLLQNACSRSPVGFNPHLTLRETDSSRGIAGLTHRGLQEPAIPVPRLCHLPESPSHLRGHCQTSGYPCPLRCPGPGDRTTHQETCPQVLFRRPTGGNCKAKRIAWRDAKFRKVSQSWEGRQS